MKSGLLLKGFVVTIIMVLVFTGYSFHKSWLNALLLQFDFDQSSQYTFDPGLTFTGGSAVLQEIDQVDDDNSPKGFGGGVSSETQFSTEENQLKLTANGIASGTGTFTSRIIDAGAPLPWETLSWTPEAPYLKELPDNGQTETAYDEDNIDMTGNIILLHFNETEGSSFSNTSGTSNNAQCNTGSGHCPLLNQPAFFKGSITFDGIDDRVTVPHHASHDALSQVSIALWVKWAGTGDGRLFEQSRDTSGHQSLWGMRVIGTKVFSEIDLNNGGIQSQYALLSNSDLPANEWTHVAYVYDGTDLKIYFNGTLDTSFVATLGSPLVGSGIYPFNGTPGLGIGNQADRDRPWKGSIDEFAVWNRSLSEDEVRTLYNRGAKRLKFQVRSCDMADCSDGEAFMGPDGTSNTWYSELDNASLGLPTLNLTNVSDNRYFQYQATLETDTSASPALSSVTVGPTGRYFAGNPTLSNITGQAFEGLHYFSDTGNVMYQLSHNGTDWYYYNATAEEWMEQGNLTNANTATEVRENIGTFTSDLSIESGVFHFRAIFNSPDGITPITLEQVFVYYDTSIGFTSTAIARQEGDTGSETIQIPIRIFSSPSSSNTENAQKDVTVSYTVTGTATGGGVDYTLPDGTVTIPAGSSSVELPVTLHADKISEPNETIIITLSNPGSGILLHNNHTITITIIDDDGSAAVASNVISSVPSGPEPTPTPTGTEAHLASPEFSTPSVSPVIPSSVAPVTVETMLETANQQILLSITPETGSITVGNISITPLPSTTVHINKISIPLTEAIQKLTSAEITAEEYQQITAQAVKVLVPLVIEEQVRQLMAQLSHPAATESTSSSEAPAMILTSENISSILLQQTLQSTLQILPPEKAVPVILLELGKNILRNEALMQFTIASGQPKETLFDVTTALLASTTASSPSFLSQFSTQITQTLAQKTGLETGPENINNPLTKSELALMLTNILRLTPTTMSGGPIGLLHQLGIFSTPDNPDYIILGQDLQRVISKASTHETGVSYVIDLDTYGLEPGDSMTENIAVDIMLDLIRKRIFTPEVLLF